MRSFYLFLRILLAKEIFLLSFYLLLLKYTNKPFYKNCVWKEKYGKEKQSWYPMLFVFYAQPLSLAAHTAGAALSSILKSLYPKLFVSLKKTKKILMEKKGYWLRRDKRSMLSKGYRLRIGYWYLFFLH